MHGRRGTVSLVVERRTACGLSGCPTGRHVPERVPVRPPRTRDPPGQVPRRPEVGDIGGPRRVAQAGPRSRGDNPRKPTEIWRGPAGRRSTDRRGDPRDPGNGVLPTAGRGGTVR